MTHRSVILVLLLAFALSLGSQRFHIGTRHPEPPIGWRNLGAAPDKHPVTFSIFLKERNLDTLESIFEQVSDPTSPRWGEFLTQKQIDDLTRPDEAVYREFDSWVAPFVQAKLLSAKKFANSIEVTTTAGVASILFQVPFHMYHHVASRKTLIRYTGKATMPASFSEHVEFVAGLSELFTGILDAKYSGNAVHYSQKKSRDPSPTVVPSLLKQFYRVPSGAVANNPRNLQSIAAFDDEFSLGALKQFATDQQVPVANVTRVGPDCLPNCDQYESDLDVQYITALAPGANTLFIAQGSNYWILQTVNEIYNQLPQKPHVISFSYGWSELLQCDIAITNCPTLGYNSQQYVRATNNVLLKFGVLGLTALVSDGDDGAASLGGASGNCPIDPNVYCPGGGCQHTSSSCNSFTVKNMTTGQLCFFPMGIGSDGCSGFLNDNNANDAIQAFFSANQQCNLNLENDGGNLPHFYSECTCDKLQSTTSSGYTFSQYTFDQANGPVFSADYPTSSPYVTSVGATQFIGTSSDPSQLKEVGCTILKGAAITTGGGFSSFQPQPKYQAQAVAAYLANPKAQLPPSFSFNSSYRGYPDIAFCGHSYKIFSSDDSSDNCPCSEGLVDGTSASSPAFAALVTLINDQLLDQGHSPVGFLNIMLYQMYASDPTIFNDITDGNNKCNRAYCCQYGYANAPGTWDPVTGLGTPKYDKMLAYIVHQKERHAALKKLN